MLGSLKTMITAAPGPGRLMNNLESRSEYCLMLEPEGLSVAADRGFIGLREGQPDLRYCFCASILEESHSDQAPQSPQSWPELIPNGATLRLSPTLI